MEISAIQSHKYTKLVEFALVNKTFSVKQACDKSGLSEREFQLAKPAIFVLTGRENYNEPYSEFCDWQIKPETLFSYISYLEFRHSLANAKKAHWMSVLSLFTAGASLLVAVYAVIGGG